MDKIEREDTRDLNRDPLTGAPGAHPVGVGMGGLGGAAAGAAIGALAGPIGMLIGAGLGTVAGAAAGKSVAERIDPTGEEEFWRVSYSSRPYHDARFDYENDYAPAYGYGVDVRTREPERSWDERLEQELDAGWGQVRGQSRLEWDHARDAVRDAWERSDRTYRAYDASDRYYAEQFEASTDREPGARFDDYRDAYRYGTRARSLQRDRAWDPALEDELASGWDQARGSSPLQWDQAKSATRHAWQDIDRVLPGSTDPRGSDRR